MSKTMKIIIDYMRQEKEKLDRLGELTFDSKAEMNLIEIGLLHSARRFFSRLLVSQQGEIIGNDDLTPMALIRFRSAVRRFLYAVRALDSRPCPLPDYDGSKANPEYQYALARGVCDNEGIGQLSACLGFAQNAVVVRYNETMDVVEFPGVGLQCLNDRQYGVNHVLSRYERNIQKIYEEIKK